MSAIITALRSATRRHISTASPLHLALQQKATRSTGGAPVILKPDWKRLASNSAQQSVVFTAFYSVVLGWPLFAEFVLDGHV